MRLRGLQLLEPQFQLLDLARELLRGAAELQPAKLRDQKLQLIDFDRVRGQLRALLEHQLLERFDIIG